MQLWFRPILNSVPRTYGHHHAMSLEVSNPKQETFGSGWLSRLLILKCNCRNVLSTLARLRDLFNIVKSHRNPFETGGQKSSGVLLSLWSQNSPIGPFKFSKPLQESTRPLAKKAKISQNLNRDSCSEHLCAYRLKNPLRHSSFHDSWSPLSLSRQHGCQCRDQYKSVSEVRREFSRSSALGDFLRISLNYHASQNPNHQRSENVTAVAPKFAVFCALLIANHSGKDRSSGTITDCSLAPFRPSNRSIDLWFDFSAVECLNADIQRNFCSRGISRKPNFYDESWLTRSIIKLFTHCSAFCARFHGSPPTVLENERMSILNQRFPLQSCGAFAEIASPNMAWAHSQGFDSPHCSFFDCFIYIVHLKRRLLSPGNI
jgi:hypothetical protein